MKILRKTRFLSYRVSVPDCSDGKFRAAWPCADVRLIAGPDGRPRLHAVAAPKRAFVEIDDTITR